MLARRPLASAVTLYSLVALAAAIAAYFAIFSQFGSGDDEGTLLVTLKAFAHGQTLYRDVYSPYGPFYYELFGGFFSRSGLGRAACTGYRCSGSPAGCCSGRRR